METIASFQINHLKLQSGLYVSKKYNVGTIPITVFDVRMKRPYKDSVMSTGSIHTIEHIVATFLRNDKEFSSRIIYFGPMGCRTGFYFIVKGDLNSKDVISLLIRAYDYVVDFVGEIPGATPIQCGYCYDMDLEAAKSDSIAYSKILKSATSENLIYP
ncbi:MAG: S-ribosylhomocysteine lyase [Christensenellaceae bacterium]|jgi:S-ribosylhomocysteine lyase|nr:S-ribosylhomocysteine lyase [Christensenellaceae bacterium]